MRLTIIPSDGAVYVDTVCHSGLTWSGTPVDVHALQWYDVGGWIEFKTGGQNEQITTLPEWANNAVAAWEIANTPQPPAPPTAEQNQAYAATLLYETDWTTIPDVADPAKSNPYLTNADAFLVYRNEVRQYAINPIAGDIAWPVRPNAVWSA